MSAIQNINHQKLGSVSITGFSFSSSFFFYRSSSQSDGFNPRRTAADPEAPCGWVIPRRSPRTSSCQRVCRKTWGPYLADCHNCTGPGASPIPPGPPGTGRCNRRPNHLHHNSSSPFDVVSAETLVLAPLGLVMTGPNGLVPR